jgi:hypothetical protein
VSVNISTETDGDSYADIRVDDKEVVSVDVSGGNAVVRVINPNTQVDSAEEFEFFLSKAGGGS